jgi:hypothetical protein
LKFTYYLSALGGEDSARALEAKKEQIQVLQNICKQKPSRQLAFQYEMLAEVAEDLGQSLLAMASFEEALRLHRLVSGCDSPYTVCVEKALLKVTNCKMVGERRDSIVTIF